MKLTSIIPAAWLFIIISLASAPAAFCLVTSTESVRTEMDALELMSQQTGHKSDKFAHDYIYTGSDRTNPLTTRPAVYADMGAVPAPTAKYTAQASVLRADMKGRVPALTVAPEMAGLKAKNSSAPQTAKAADGQKTEKSAQTEKSDKSVFQKIGDWFSSAFQAVKGWITNAVTWVHDSLVGKKRGLTAEETAEMRKVFGDNVDYSKVRIVDGDKQGLWGKILTGGGAAVTWGKTIYFPKGADGKSQYDFSTKGYWLAHEMTHEYQYQKDGWGYAAKSVWGQFTKGDSFYDYQLEAGKSFGKYNVEQQGDLVAHYYQILNGTRSATPAELAIYQQIMKDQGLF